MIYFTDPLLRAPTLGAMLVGLTAGLAGVLLFVRRRSLLGEALSHATYPGVTLAAVGASLVGGAPVWILGLALLFSLLGYAFLHFMQTRLRVSADAALCMVLATFFGVGVTIASYVQFSHPGEYRSCQAYLYGQVATMQDHHLYLYAFLAVAIAAALFLFFKELQTLSFDQQFARIVGLAPKWVEALSLLLIVVAIVMGIRTVGVVLMSALLIAPPTAARQFTNRMGPLFVLSAAFGVASAFLGTYLSVELSTLLRQPGWRASLPTGPLIVLVASSFTLLSLLLAPERGVLIRYVRIARFRSQRLQENLLKLFWRAESTQLTFSELVQTQGLSTWYIRLVLLHMEGKGWLASPKRGAFALTKLGKRRGARIVRLHRLWELYLVEHLAMGADAVHKSAEEMEHILTPAIERELTLLLDNPDSDPHAQPIPAHDEVILHG